LTTILDPTSSGSLAYILPGNKLIIGTTIISSLSDTELAHLLSHSIAHLLLQHRRENESLLHLITPFVWTFPVLDWKMYFAQVPILWVFGNYYGKRLREKQEEEAERMAARMVENAGFVKVVGGLDGFWRCANLS
jgi:Zn-dependent protease with chaperone function